jgi:predicted Zn-dependent protease
MTSFHALDRAEAAGFRQWRSRVVIAKRGDSLAKLPAHVAPEGFREDRFRVLNGLSSVDELLQGRPCKVV